MNGTIFGIGPLEVLMVGILILLVFGPERLPELTRGLGTALRRLRETYVAFTAEFRGELQPIASEFDQVTREIRKEVDAIREATDIRTMLQPYADDVSKAVKLEPIPAQPPAPSLPAPAAAKAGPAAAKDAAGAPSPANTIAPPKPAAAQKNGAKRAAPAPAAPLFDNPVVLPADNPWSSIGAEVRADKLDDDSPWKL